MSELRVFSNVSNILIIGTLDGSLYGFDYVKNKILWKNSKIIQANKSACPEYFLEPFKDGILYKKTENEKFQRLPLSVSEFVSFSPLKTEDTLYVGQKKSFFLKINLLTGKIEKITNKYEKTVLETQKNIVFVGVCEFSFSIYDLKGDKKNSLIMYTRLSAQVPCSKTKKYCTYSDSLFSGKFLNSPPIFFASCLYINEKILLQEMDLFCVSNQNKKTLVLDPEKGFFIFSYQKHRLFSENVFFSNIKVTHNNTHDFPRITTRRYPFLIEDKKEVKSFKNFSIFLSFFLVFLFVFFKRRRKLKTNSVIEDGLDSVFFEGTFNNSSVYIQKIKGVFHRTENIIKIKTHPRVAVPCATEHHGGSIYFLFNIFGNSLSRLVEKKTEANERDLFEKNRNSILKDISTGLFHMHQHGLVHGGITPSNVLITKDETKGVLLFTDVYKQQRRKERKGGISWNSPDETNDSFSSDIFLLGWLFLYVLRDGCLYNEEVFKEDQIEKNLIKKMISFDKKERPTILQVLSHPFFWNNKKRLDFLCELSNRLERELFPSKLLASFEKIGPRAVPSNDWFFQIDPELLIELQSHRGYRRNSILDLLRAIRNKRNHPEMTALFEKTHGIRPIDYYFYFVSLFPSLLIESYEFTLSTGLIEETCLKEFGFSKLIVKD